MIWFLNVFSGSCAICMHKCTVFNTFFFFFTFSQCWPLFGFCRIRITYYWLTSRWKVCSIYCRQCLSFSSDKDKCILVFVVNVFKYSLALNEIAVSFTLRRILKSTNKNKQRQKHAIPCNAYIRRYKIRMDDETNSSFKCCTK